MADGSIVDMVGTAAATGPMAARRDGPHPMDDIFSQSSGVAARVLMFGKGEAPPAQPGLYLRDKVIRHPSWTTRMIQVRRGTVPLPFVCRARNLIGLCSMVARAVKALGILSFGGFGGLSKPRFRRNVPITLGPVPWVKFEK